MENRTGIFRVVAEAGTGKSAIFLPGFSGNELIYREVIEELAKIYHVYVPQLHFGLNEEPVSEITEYAKALKEMINSRKLKNITLIGHSIGGAVALKLAESDRRISRLILVDSGGLAIPYSFIKFVWLLLLKTWHQIFDYPKNLNIWKRIVVNFLHFFKKSLPRINETVEKTMQIAKGGDIDFRKIQIPTLILWGKQDEVVPVVYAHMFNKLIAGSRVQVVDGGHDWLIFRSKEFANMINSNIWE
jgi:pimeloyl-ACP methyl ester carboxylesterase